MPGNLRAIMACSRDGFFCRSEHDDMSWTSAADKAVFRMLTQQVDGLCAASARTLGCMPESLPGRRLVCVERRPRLSVRLDSVSLEELAERPDGAWLLGGPTLLRAALERDLLRSLTLVVSDVSLNAACAKYDVSGVLTSMLRFERLPPVKIADVEVHTLRRD